MNKQPFYRNLEILPIWCKTYEDRLREHVAQGDPAKAQPLSPSSAVV